MLLKFKSRVGHTPVVYITLRDYGRNFETEKFIK